MLGSNSCLLRRVLKSQVHDACCSNPDYAKLIVMAKEHDMIKTTDLTPAHNLSRNVEFRLFIKREDQQLGFSPHVRGLYNSLSHINPQNRWRGVVIPSEGQYARAIACSARLLKIPAVILVGPGMRPNEVQELERMGSVVQLASNTLSGPLSAAFNVQALYLDPLNDPYTLAGLGTVALEIFRQMKDDQQLEGIFCSARPGGTIEAIGLSVKQFAPHVKVVGVDTLPSAELSKIYEVPTDLSTPGYDVQIPSVLKTEHPTTFCLDNNYLSKIY